MSPLTIRLVRAALACLAAGIFLGASFALNRAAGPALRPLHAELNMWGWTTLLIYGLAYHMLPRFAGRPLASPALAEAQSWLAIGGVAAAAAGWLARGTPAGAALLAAGGLAQLAAAAAFALLAAGLLRTADPRHRC